MTDRIKTGAADMTFTDADFQVISRYAAERYGLDIKIEKKGLIYARLARRIRALGMPDFRTYCSMATGPAAAEEREELLSALTTNVSSFYRERHHFEILRKDVLPALRKKVIQGQPVRIWSAGCSNGQEPYSIAATLTEAWPDVADRDVKILATDVDPRVVATAKTGLYRASEGSGLTAQEHHLLFEKAPRNATHLNVRSTLRDMVTFDEVNLVSNWRHPAPFDVIFCRNVVIYFERTTQHRLWQSFSASLLPQGYLFIGHSERLSGPAESHFRNVGVTAFAKTAP